MGIKDDIKQTRFNDEYEKGFVNILFTTSWLNARQTEVLRPFELSVQQFNILRILRGRYPEPSTIKLLTSRMIDRMSNASRLVEKLKQRGLVDRQPCEDDRRRVDIVITEQGLQLLEEASQAMYILIEKTMRITEEEAATLNKVLDRIRETAD